jgi:hypothetical protein
VKREFTLTKCGIWWIVQFERRNTRETRIEILRWCEAEWGNVYKNHRYGYLIDADLTPKIRIKYDSDAFAFKMRWG